MASNAIEIYNLSKRYHLQGFKLSRQRLLSEQLSRWLTLKQPPQLDSSYIWALKNVSFSVAQGQAVGILGTNGSGKSTLLKILARVTTPTEGKVIIRGRLGAMLEVGVGFHPELTGRENTYLLGTTLGLSKKEIDQRFDSIIEFADLKKFLDLPVKHYSSGMQLRLGFGVAAHLSPDVLLVDEALAVGDVAFQARSLTWMKNAVKNGSTVFFVSHQLDLIRQFCDYCVVLNKGEATVYHDVEQAIEEYAQRLGVGEDAANFVVAEDPDLPVQIVGARILDQQAVQRKSFEFFEPIVVEVTYLVRKVVSDIYFELVINSSGEPFFCSWDVDTDPERLKERVPGKYVAQIALPSPLFKAGHYTLSFNVMDSRDYTILQRLDGVVGCEIQLLHTKDELVSFSQGRGRVAVPLNWKTRRVDVDLQ